MNGDNNRASARQIELWFKSRLPLFFQDLGQCVPKTSPLRTGFLISHSLDAEIAFDSLVQTLTFSELWHLAQRFDRNDD